MGFSAVAAAAIGAGATAYAGSKAASASKSAANTAADAQSAATQATIAEQARQYDQTREDLAPWRQTGQNALMNIANLSGSNGVEAMTQAQNAFQFSPGYQFRLQQGQQAIENSAAARGALLSGSALKAIGDYGQNVASDEYGNYYNRLATLAGVGQTATNSTAAAGQSAANAIGSAYTAQGNALSNIALSSGNAQAANAQQTGANINNLTGNLLTGYLYNQPSATSANSAVGYIQRNPSSAWNLGAAP